MLVLGLDPGLAITGFALVESDDGQDLKTLSYGVVRTPADLLISERLVQLHEELADIIAEYQPDAAAVEELFFATNARTAIMVGEARGVILLTLAEAGLEIAEYTPMQIKQAVTGYGGADKIQIQEMVRLLLGLSEIPRPDDAADALAVSICYHHSMKMERMLGEAES